nr:uncharacterized protein LOC108175460 [Oryctolagus cuniculus]
MEPVMGARVWFCNLGKIILNLFLCLKLEPPHQANGAVNENMKMIVYCLAWFMNPITWGEKSSRHGACTIRRHLSHSSSKLGSSVESTERKAFMLVGEEGGRSICHSKGKGAQDLWNACTYPPGLSTYGSHWPAGGAAGSPPCQSPCNLGRPAGQELESCLSQVLSHSLHMLWSSTQSSSRHCPWLSFVYICFDLCRATLTCACSDLLNGDSLAEILCHAESDRGVWVQFVGKIA